MQGNFEAIIIFNIFIEFIVSYISLHMGCGFPWRPEERVRSPVSIGNQTPVPWKRIKFSELLNHPTVPHLHSLDYGTTIISVYALKVKAGESECFLILFLNTLITLNSRTQSKSRSPTSVFPSQRYSGLFNMFFRALTILPKYPDSQWVTQKHKLWLLVTIWEK